MKFVDLFCGIGGFHQALNKLDFECVFACDIDNDCRKTYEKNYNIKPQKDIRNVDITKIPNFDILCAGFPCQPFSKAGQQKGFNDKRANLFYNICYIIEYHCPKYLILENVKMLKSHDKGKTWKIIYKKINDMGYLTYDQPIILNTLHFNIPQFRERAYILCINKKIGNLPLLPKIPKIIKKNLSCCVKNILIKNKKYNKKYLISDKLLSVKHIWNEFLDILNDNHIKIPKFPIWTDWWDSDGLNSNLYKINKKLTNDENKDVIEVKVQNFYKRYENLIKKNRKFYKDNEELLINWLLKSRLNQHWTTSLRKLEWQVAFNKQSNLNTNIFTVRSSGIRVKDINYTPTLVAMSHIPIIGSKNRYMTPKECLRLQCFPNNFVIVGSDKKIYKQVGNAVNCYVIKKLTELLIYNKELFRKSI